MYNTVNCDILPYAVDTILLSNGQKVSQCTENWESNMANSLSYFRQYSLKINQGKTEFIVFGNNSKKPETMHIGDQIINGLNEINFLGVLTDN